ncbi:hypothetical protein [Algoriphagus sp.]|uniref:hypothetical protein n=1 Tax=Algoriphagus sp. TaxID=1872435 RepID=UPI0027270FD6|nr:hypothetical protein [Algoriphagus sp.]MDO8969018.1 hypothetical protein [Algoriphagus sp.]MDP3200249.1 hypothetical protein [Algoriphagus sp.]
MKRRNFLKSLPVFAVAPLTFSANPKNASNSRHLIALGSAACRLAYSNFEGLSFDTVTFIDRENPGNIVERQIFISFQSPDHLFDQVEHLRIPKKECLPVLPLKPEIQRHLQILKGDLIFFSRIGWDDSYTS